MAACRGCNSRLKVATGSSGYCNPCYLYVRVQQLVFTRVPPVSAEELFQYLRRVVDTIESACERFESDRTAGLVSADGVPIPGKKRDSGQDPFSRGIHQGDRDAEAGSARVPVKKESEAEKDQEKEPVEDAKAETDKSHHRRRRSRTRTRRDKSRSRRRRSKEDKPKSRGNSPGHTEVETEADKTPEEAVVATPEEEEEEEAEEPQPVVHDDEESDRKYNLSRTAKPSARKPLPRRPRTPSHSPPGYYQEDSRRAPRWKGYKHVLRGQYYSNRGSGRGKGQGKGWRRK